MRDAELHLVEEQRLLDGRLEQLDLARRLVGNTEVPDLSRCLQRIEGGGDFLGLDQRIGAMQEEHIEILGLQRHQGLVDRAQDVLGRKVEEAVPDAGLALDHDARPLLGRQVDGLAETLLAAM